MFYSVGKKYISKLLFAHKTFAFSQETAFACKYKITHFIFF